MLTKATEKTMSRVPKVTAANRCRKSIVFLLKSARGVDGLQDSRCGLTAT